MGLIAEARNIQTKDPAAKSLLEVMLLYPGFHVLAFMWDGVYAGATAGRHIRNAMIYAALGFVACYLATYWWMGIQGLYIAYFAHLVARVVYLTAAWKKIA